MTFYNTEHHSTVDTFFGFHLLLCAVHNIFMLGEDLWSAGENENEFDKFIRKRRVRFDVIIFVTWGWWWIAETEEIRSSSRFSENFTELHQPNRPMHFAKNRSNSIYTRETDLTNSTCLHLSSFVRDLYTSLTIRRRPKKTKKYPCQDMKRKDCKMIAPWNEFSLYFSIFSS